MSISFFFKRLLPVAFALGTAWAARGQIGHEYGAAWAGAIGVLAVILISGRADWYSRLPAIVALGGIAWGIGGIISYGKVVGYGQAADYTNTSYGLLMLFVIGGLYGFLGGGITGLMLESTPARKVNMAALITEMVAGGFLCWGFFIYQLEWVMTPPRSELWAGCLGAAFALGWYLYRNGYNHALKTAFYTALGAGFGFAIGDFFQRMGRGTGVDFNWWNVMEYSIGFFGGLGFSYGIYSQKNWPETIKANRSANIAGWIFLVLILPAINLIEGMNTKTMTDIAARLQVSDVSSFALNWQLFAWILSCTCMIVLTAFFRPGRPAAINRQKVVLFFFMFLTWYILISNIIGATWITPKFSSQHLYWVNLLVLLCMLLKRDTYQIGEVAGTAGSRNLLLIWIGAILVILVLSFIAVSSGYNNPKVQLRF